MVWKFARERWKEDPSALSAGEGLQAVSTRALERFEKTRDLIIAASILLISVAPGFANSNCPDPDNVVTNCGFDVNDFTGWFFGEGSPYHDPTNGSTSNGSMCVNAADDGGTWLVHLGYCITSFTDAATYLGGQTYRQEMGGAMLNNYVELSQRPQTNCGGSPTVIGLVSDVPMDGTWRDSPTLDITTTSPSGGLGLIAYFEAAAPFVVCFDDAYVGIGLEPVILPIFEDDFEDGTTTAWSSVVP